MGEKLYPIDSFYMTTAISSTDNLECIENEMQWLSSRIDNLLNKEIPNFFPLPALKKGTGYESLVTEFELKEADRVLLNLALASVIAPETLREFAKVGDEHSLKYKTGIVRSKEAKFLRPTVRTALFLLAENDVEKFSYYFCHFKPENMLFLSGLIWTKPMDSFDPFVDHVIRVNEKFMPMILHYNPR